MEQIAQKIKLKQNGKKLKQSRKRQRPSRNETENIKDQEMEWKHQYRTDSTKDQVETEWKAPKIKQKQNGKHQRSRNRMEVPKTKLK